MKKKRVTKSVKSQHYQLKWNVLQAAEIAIDFEKKHGKAEIDYPTLKRIYTGNLLEALYFKRIVNHQNYGCTFYADIELLDGSRGIVERSIKLSEPMRLTQFFEGYEECYINHGSGLKSKGWKGASRFWLDMLDEEFRGSNCHDAWAVANCLVKPTTGRSIA